MSPVNEAIPVPFEELPEECNPLDFSLGLTRWLDHTRNVEVLLRLYRTRVTGKIRKQWIPDFTRPCGEALWSPKDHDFDVGRFLTAAATQEHYQRAGLGDIDFDDVYFVQAFDDRDRKLTSTKVIIGETHDTEAEAEPTDPVDARFDAFRARFADWLFRMMEGRFEHHLNRQAAPGPDGPVPVETTPAPAVPAERPTPKPATPNLVKETGDWYDRYIETPVRDLVRHLRDNGVNTECSCGHEMYVQCQLIPDGTLKHIHDLMWNFLSDRDLPVTYDIDAHIHCVAGKWFAGITIQLPQE